MSRSNLAATTFFLVASANCGAAHAVNVGGPVEPPVPVGADSLRINGNAAVARGPLGDYLVMWQQSGDDGGSSNGIFARRFSAAGQPLDAGPFLANQTTAFAQEKPSVDSTADGGFIAVWESDSQVGSFRTIVARQFNFTGSSSPEFALSAAAGNDQLHPTIGVDNTNRFVVAWQKSNTSIVIRRFDGGGSTPLTDEIRVDDAAVFQGEAHPSIGMNAEGTFAVAWTAGTPAQGIAVRRFDIAGTPQTPPILVSSTVSGSSSDPAPRPVVGVDAAGNFMVVWTSGSTILARRYAADGSALSAEFAVSTTADRPLQRPQIAMNEDGGATVSWSGDAGADPATVPHVVRARRIGAAGAPVGAEIQVASTRGIAPNPDIAADIDGDFVVAWSRPVGDRTDIVAQRFAGPENVDLEMGLQLGSSAGTTCDPVQFTLSVTNRHAAAAPGVGNSSGALVTLTATGNAEIQGSEASLVPCELGGNPLLCRTQTLRPGEVGANTFVVLAPSTPGTLTVTASLAGDHRDPTAANNTASIDAPIATGAPPGTLNLGLSSNTVPESGSVALTITRTGGSNCTVSATAATGGGTATSGADYTPVLQSLVWPDGDITPRTLVLQTNADEIDESTETLNAALSNIVGAAAGTVGATLSIEDDDTAGLSFFVPGSEFVLAEGAAPVTYQVRLNSQPTAPVTIQISGSRLAPVPSSLTFNDSNWNVARSVQISAVNDSNAQGDQTVTLTHAVTSADPRYNLPPITNAILIQDDEPAVAPGGGGGAIGWLLLGLGLGGSLVRRPRLSGPGRDRRRLE